MGKSYQKVRIILHTQQSTSLHPNFNTQRTATKHVGYPQVREQQYSA